MYAESNRNPDDIGDAIIHEIRMAISASNDITHLRQIVARHSSLDVSGLQFVSYSSRLLFYLITILEI